MVWLFYRDPQAADAAGRSPLGAAAFSGNLSGVDILVELLAPRRHAADNYAPTGEAQWIEELAGALQLSCEAGHAAVVRYLLSASSLIGRKAEVAPSHRLLPSLPASAVHAGLVAASVAGHVEIARYLADGLGCLCAVDVGGKKKNGTRGVRDTSYGTGKRKDSRRSAPVRRLRGLGNFELHGNRSFR
eukprot:SAG31_NODE_3495_length_4199_cov_2.274878_2_plen_188_part_00